MSETAAVASWLFLVSATYFPHFSTFGAQCLQCYTYHDILNITHCGNEVINCTYLQLQLMHIQRSLKTLFSSQTMNATSALKSNPIIYLTEDTCDVCFKCLFYIVFECLFLNTPYTWQHVPHTEAGTVELQCVTAQCGRLTCGEEDDQDEHNPQIICQSGLHWWQLPKKMKCSCKRGTNIYINTQICSLCLHKQGKQSVRKIRNRLLIKWRIELKKALCAFVASL